MTKELIAATLARRDEFIAFTLAFEAVAATRLVFHALYVSQLICFDDAGQAAIRLMARCVGVAQ